MHYLRKFGIPLAIVLAAAIAADQYGSAGFLLVLGGVIMWLLLHFTRMMAILRRAARRPIGYCDSAVMLNAKLKKGLPLMHVVAMTRAMGEQMSRPNAEPEWYQWTDNAWSVVRCEFRHGRLESWALERPPEPIAEARWTGDGAAPAATSAPAASTGS